MFGSTATLYDYFSLSYFTKRWLQTQFFTSLNPRGLTLYLNMFNKPVCLCRA